jgi:hypothetical protein
MNVTTTPGPPEPTLPSVVDALRRGVDAEVRFLRRATARVPELVLRGGRALGQARSGRWLYQFESAEGTAERFLDQDAMLVAPATAIRASVVDLTRNELVVEIGQAIAPADSGWRLVLRPGMLLERLSEALERCLHDPAFCVETALRSLGLRPSRRLPGQSAPAAAPGLNESQGRAIATALERDLSLIWGPPGTGKTRVIAHLVAALCRGGERVLLTSTTNAAVDNAVEALQAETWGGPPLSIYRVRGAALARAATPPPEAIEQRQRLELRTAQAQQCRRLIDHLSASPRQQSLAFAERSTLVRPAELGGLFPGREEQVSGMQREALMACLTLRLRRVEALSRGYQGRLRAGISGASVEREAMARAMVVAATLTSTYTLETVAADRFDVVVVDEASMAGLPVIFYCAGLARKRAVFVGDPRQLPPIVEAPDSVVRATLGRTVFDVKGRGTEEADGTVLLDTQYRMHPAIGGLVSELFYQGHLESPPPRPDLVRLVDSEPFPGSPLVVVDLAGTQHRCERHGPSSRINRASAELAVRLATVSARSGASVAIITPYAAQARLVRAMVASSSAPAEIACATVHRFQGAEADVVIIDLVDGAPLRPGLLLNDQSPGSAARALVNVSISRARAKLIVIGDLSYFGQQAGGPVVELLRLLQTRGWVCQEVGPGTLDGAIRQS